MKTKKINKNIKIVIANSVLAVVIILFATAVNFSVRFSYQKPQTVWQDILSRAGFGKPSADAASKIIFLGDSITFQEDWGVLFEVNDIANAGISGNTTEDILGRLDSAISAKPQKLFLMIGINDLLRKEDVPYVFANYEKIISEIKLKSPGTTIYMESVLPMDNSLAGARFGTVEGQKIIDLNSQIKSLADGNEIFFIDLYPYFCGANDVLYTAYGKDGLHLNSHGYAEWKKLIIQYVK